jgi:nucleoside-diphosphate-sugar epimerase
MTSPQNGFVAVVGASGFIGTRIVEHLVLATAGRVRAVLRSFSQLSRLSELPQDRLAFIKADLLDRWALERAFVDCDTVIDCSYGSHGPAEQQWQTTIEGARNLVHAVRTAGVSRLVHLSSAAILDVRGRDVFDDDCPKVNAPFPSYENAKRVAEEIVLAAGIKSVTLRPTVVYGPWGRDWTLSILQRLSAGGRGLPSSRNGAGGGISNAVYVDDVVSAVLRACAASAEGPVLVGPAEVVSWGEFYDAFRNLVPESDFASALVAEWEQSLYAQRARADIRRAQRVLSYEPQVSFVEGMRRVASWYRWFACGTRYSRGSEITRASMEPKHRSTAPA